MKKIFIFIVFVGFLVCNSKSGREVKSASLAGTWYPSDPVRLEKTISSLYKKTMPVNSSCSPLVLILPHAGYQYSGQVAANGYESVKNKAPDVILIMAPSHRGRIKGCALHPAEFFETPLGRIKTAKDINPLLLKNSLFRTDGGAFENEHAIEIHLPLIQGLYEKTALRKTPVLPILVGDIGPAESESIARTIAAALSSFKNPLLIVSSDFTHYGERFGFTPFAGPDKVVREKIKKLDFGAIGFIKKKDPEGFSKYLDNTGATICGRNPILIAVSLPINGFKAGIIDYNTSGNITGDFKNTVSYAAIFICGKIGTAEAEARPRDFLSNSDKKFLLGIARKNLESRLFRNNPYNPDKSQIPASCKTRAGVFVTIKKAGELRGCIGYIEGLKPLYKAVLDNSFNAGFRDPRFNPLAKNEFRDLKLEISVLTPPEPVKSVDEISIGRDGLIIEKGMRKGIFLPQVAVEWNWDLDQYLANLCRKAGLAEGEWKKGASLYRFEAIVFSEDNNE
ncbi:MAG: AmmeMemoRadiSam system protein B [Spirochaetes bacterium]|jgi:hypothetical protein|nr:AmmeMemoRadiSam system protein B [Spirochaetota bacterium]